jgi:hypothetical protein
MSPWLAFLGVIVALALIVGTMADSSSEPRGHLDHGAIVAADDVGGVLAGTRAPAPNCPAPVIPRGYTRSVRRALLAGRDLWGDQLLHAPDGPTYEGVRQYLPPLVYARGRGGRPLTSSGVYYLPFSFPISVNGPRDFALHVADGSEIITRRVGGRTLALYVGTAGRERYGACLGRLTPARLADRYLPILQSSYVDEVGVRYRQESFAARVWGSTSLISFVRLTVDARHSRAGAIVRLVPSRRHLIDAGNTLRSSAGTQLLFSTGGRFDGSAVRYIVAAGGRAEIYAGWLHRPSQTSTLRADRTTYEAGRIAVSRIWQDRLTRAATFAVSDERVLDAQRGLLVQQLTLGWRYSVGNAYEELSFAETLDNAEVVAAYGLGDAAKAILRFSLAQLPKRLTSWRVGEHFVAGAAYYRLFHDRAFVEEQTPELARALGVLVTRQIESGTRSGLLDHERYSSDIPTEVYGLHGQAVVWEGLLAMGRVWAETGHPRLAGRARTLAIGLEEGLRHSVRDSKVRLADGSLFVPVALRDGGEPFDRLTATREGSYWNLVMPYALASGLFRPHGPESDGILQYLSGHGSRLLGLVRAAAYPLYGKGAYPASGTDHVYGLAAARFLADNDQPDQLALTLYGALAAGMTQGTYVSGEAASVAPLENTYGRTMYLPPNSGTNAGFLETLRLMLVHETRDRRGAATGLELAFATPRPWLAQGRKILVRGAPTSFGPVSFSIERSAARVRVNVDPPSAHSAFALRLRLRLPTRDRIARVRFGTTSVPYDGRSGTIELSGRRGHLELDVTLQSSRRP